MCLKFVGNNNISTSQGRRFYKMNDDTNLHSSKSNTISTPQDDNSIPFENVGPDAFVNALEDRIIDDHDSQ